MKFHNCSSRLITGVNASRATKGITNAVMILEATEVPSNYHGSHSDNIMPQQCPLFTVLEPLWWKYWVVKARGQGTRDEAHGAKPLAQQARGVSPWCPVSGGWPSPQFRVWPATLGLTCNSGSPLVSKPRKSKAMDFKSRLGRTDGICER